MSEVDTIGADIVSPSAGLLWCGQCTAFLNPSKFDRKGGKGKLKRVCRDCCKRIGEQVRASGVRLRKLRESHFRDDAKSQKGWDYTGRNAWLRLLGFADYQSYLASDLWKSIRARVFAAKGRKCYLCDGEATQVHHVRYHKNDLTGKRLKFLEPICQPCHERIEFTEGKKNTVQESRESSRQRRKHTRR